jgi:hypothetical protein
MSATTPALFAAAAGVGLGHAILPDHWSSEGGVAQAAPERPDGGPGCRSNHDVGHRNFLSCCVSSSGLAIV